VKAAPHYVRMSRTPSPLLVIEREPRYKGQRVGLLFTMGFRSAFRPGVSTKGRVRGSASARLGAVRDGSRRMRPPRFLPTGHGGGAMSDPGFTRPDPCSIRAVRQLGTGGTRLVASGRRQDDDRARGVLRRLPDDRGDQHRPRHPPVHGGGRAGRGGYRAYVSCWHAYAVVRAHGESGITARLEPTTIDGLVYASSMVILYAARHRVPVSPWPAGCSGWASRPPSRRTWLRAGYTVPSYGGRGRPAVSLVGSYERDPGVAHPHRRGAGTRTAGGALLREYGVPRCGAFRPSRSRSQRPGQPEGPRSVRPGLAPPKAQPAGQPAAPAGTVHGDGVL